MSNFLKPCPICKRKAYRNFINCDALKTEIIQCSAGCGYPKRIFPHARKEWLKELGWTDLAAMWNSCWVEKDPETGMESLCFEKGPYYIPEKEVCGPFLKWSPSISEKNISRLKLIRLDG